MKTIYANSLLSDDKILFWYTGQSPCLDWREFYKDFYYAGIDATEYEKQHTLRIARMGFEDNTENEDYNSLIFDVLAKDFYRQFDISEDSKGEKPYQPTADVVPKSEVEKLKSDLLVWKQNRFNIFQRLECYEMTRQKIAREIFEEIESKKMFLKDCVGNMGVVVLFKDISELKKKYTEEKK